MISSQNTVIFWGAGASASLGFQTTMQQAKSLKALAADQDGQSLEERVEEALGDRAQEPWISAFCDLLTILGDGQEGGNPDDESTFDVKPHHVNIMGEYWSAGPGDLRNRVINMRMLYDWLALKAIINVCPGIERECRGFQLNDLFNLLDMHSQSGHGFRVEGQFLAPQRVLRARNAVKMLQQTMLYIDWQHGRVKKKEHLDYHYDFARALGRRMQRKGVELNDDKTPPDSRAFYMGDVSFACFNWDPVALWCQFVANRDLNRGACPHINVGGCSCRLLVFHDLGHFVPGPRVEPKDEQHDLETPWHPMNESSARQLNDDDHGASVRVRVSKFLFPHGCFWWRECPNCGKLSSYIGDAWERDSPTLIPPPPFKAFVLDEMFRARGDEERGAWERGEVDARACVHCKTLTYAHHTQTVMQSSFKSPPPPFLDEIKRDLRVAVQEADHVVLMGYTLPPDDVDYRAFLAARRRRTRNPVRCSVVVGKDCGRQWFGPSAWPAMLEHMPDGLPPRTTLEAARDLFGEANVRLYGGGIPDVFLDGVGVTDAAVNKLLTWEE